MDDPVGIKLSRQGGWRKPENTVTVSRPSKWGNPHKVIGKGRDARRVAVRMFEDDLYHGRLPFTVDDVRRELAGVNLACWCPLDGSCHRDVLLRAANS